MKIYTGGRGYAPKTFSMHCLEKGVLAAENYYLLYMIVFKCLACHRSLALRCCTKAWSRDPYHKRQSPPQSMYIMIYRVKMKNIKFILLRMKHYISMCFYFVFVYQVFERKETFHVLADKASVAPIDRTKKET